MTGKDKGGTKMKNQTVDGTEDRWGTSTSSSK